MFSRTKETRESFGGRKLQGDGRRGELKADWAFGQMSPPMRNAPAGVSFLYRQRALMITYARLVTHTFTYTQLFTTTRIKYSRHRTVPVPTASSVLSKNVLNPLPRVNEYVRLYLKDTYLVERRELRITSSFTERAR